MSDGPLVAVVMGSRSDWETMQHAAQKLDALGVPYEVKVVSAHRTPDVLFSYAESAGARGLRAIIAGAGGAAHLPGMVAAMTPVPVLGVPVQSKALNGLDSLLSIVQMPAGVPVATFAIGALALAGFPLTAGFFSKDAILSSIIDQGSLGWILWAAGITGAFLTGLYTFRMVFLVFWGEPTPYVREHHHAHHGREGPFSMTSTVGILAVLATIGGAIQIALLQGFAALLQIGVGQLDQTVAAETRVVAGVDDAHGQRAQPPHRPDVVGDVGVR